MWLWRRGSEEKVAGDGFREVMELEAGGPRDGPAVVCSLRRDSGAQTAQQT